jgi:hypothetical protein
MRLVPTYQIVEAPLEYVDIRMSSANARNLMQVIENMIERNMIHPTMFISSETRDLANEIKKALGHA